VKERTPISERLLLRPREVAEVTGISIYVVYEAIKSGELRASKFGPKALVITPNDLQEWINQSTTPLTGTQG
jgi:excisionase family DNA binding protein